MASTIFASRPTATSISPTRDRPGCRIPAVGFSAGEAAIRTLGFLPQVPGVPFGFNSTPFFAASGLNF